MSFATDALRGMNAARAARGLFGLRGLSGLNDGAEAPTLEDVRAADPGEGFITSTLLAPVRAAGTALSAIDYVDASTRAALGAILGVKGSGRETIAGAAPSGRELLGLGPGTKGTFESGDVPGFLVEALASPLNLIGVGALTKSGKAAQSLQRVATAEKAYRASGQIAKADALLPRLAALQSELGPAAAEFGASLGQQARRGQRSLLSFDLPGVANVPLLPSNIDAKALDLIGSGYERFVGAPLRPAYDALFRPAGKIGDAAYDTLVDVTAREGQREGVRLGQAEALDTADRLAKLPTRESDVAAVSKGLEDTVDRLARVYEQRFKRPIPDRLLRKLDVTQGLESAASPAERLTLLGLEHTGIDAKVAPHIQAINDELAQRLTRIDGEIANWRVLGEAPFWLLGRRAQAKKIAARKTFLYASKRRIGHEILAALPPDVASEVGRLAAVSGRELASDKDAGVRVSMLTDPLLGYVHHAVSPQGRALADNLLKLGVQENDALRVVRTFTTEPDFTQRRSEALRGLGILQSNQWLGDQAEKLAADTLRNPLATRAQRAAATNVQRIVAEGGRFFEENPATAILRRLASGGEARGNARLAAGVVEMFGVPKSAAGPNATPVAEFLEKAGIAKLRNVDLPTGAGGIRKALKGSGLEDIYIPVSYHQAALHSAKVLRDPEELRGVVGLFNRITSLARLAATVARPGYYARNAMGNAANMWLAGFRNPKYLREAFDLMRRRKSGSLSAVESRMLERFTDLGALESGATAEVRELTREAGVLGDRTRLQRAAGKAADAGLRFNSAIENTSKLALMLDGRARGLSDIEAAERVKKYLFDYTELSPVEKKYLRRAAFFYTFARYNLPLQIEAMLRNPRTFRAYGLATGRIGDGPQQELPDWQKNQGLVATGQGSDGLQNFVSLGLPMEDLFRYSDEGEGVARTGQKVAQNLAPTLRVPLENLFGVSLQTGLPLRGRSSDRAIASLLPGSLAQDASMLLAAEGAAPTAPITGLLRRVAESGQPEKGLARLATAWATGISPTAVDPKKAAAARLRESARRAERRLLNSGVEKDDPRLKLVRRAARAE